LGGGGHYFAPGPDEVGGGASKDDREAVGWEGGFKVGGLGRGASPRPPSWAIGHTELSAGVLGETAQPGFCGLNPAITGSGLLRLSPQRSQTLLRSAEALLRRATAGRSSGEERIYRLELDAEWVGEE